MQSQVRINRVPEKVPKKVPEKPQQLVLLLDLVLRSSDLSKYSDSHCCRLAQALVQSYVRFNRVREKVPEKVAEKVWEAVVQSQLRFNRVPEKVLEKVCKSLVQRQVRSGRLFREGSGDLVQSQVRTRFRKRFRKALVDRFNEVPEKVSGRLWCRAGLGSTRFRRRFRKALVESRGRLSEVPEKVLEKVPEGLGAARFNEASSRFWCDSGSVSAQPLGQVPANFGRKKL